MFCCYPRYSIATDALAIKILSSGDRGFGNSIQVGANYLGAMIGGGGILILLDRSGWNQSMLVMALAIFLLSIPVIFYSEKSSIEPQEKEQFNWLALFNFYFIPGMWRWLLVLFLYMMGISMAWIMQYPMLVNLGVSLSEIGLMSGIVGFSAGLVGAFVGGLLLMKPLGAKRSLKF